MMPAVSVILPTYNRMICLPRAIHSVLSQSFTDFELLVVDDCSTDGTADYLQSLDDPRIRVLRQTCNQGPSAARNLGIQKARGAWLAFQDSDDEWLADKLAEQIACASNLSSDYAMVLCGYVSKTPRRVDVVAAEHILDDQHELPDLLDGWPIITPAWLVRAGVIRALGGFDPAFRCVQDWDLILRLSRQFRVAAVRGPLLIKHDSDDSICRAPVDMCGDLIRILGDHGELWKGYPQRLARRLVHLGCLQRQTGHRRDSLQSFWRALCADPLRPVGLLFLLACLLGVRPLKFVKARVPRYASMSL